MIVIGADTHNSTLTVAAVDGATGGSAETGPRRHAGRALTSCCAELAAWTVWAIEDCRQVSAGFARRSGGPRRALRQCP
jgi:hypothetical protein